MEKAALLQELSDKLNSGELSRSEVLEQLGEPGSQATGTHDQPAATMLPRFSTTRILYVLGAATAIVGINIFLAQIWEQIGSFARIAITLGLGLLMAASGSLLLQQKPNEHIGAVFHLIAGALIPFGAVVTLLELGGEPDSLWPVAFIFGGVFAFYLLLNTAHRHAVLTLFAIASGTAFVYLLVGALMEDAARRYMFVEADVFVYLTMVTGAAYLLLAHAFREGWNRVLLGLLCLAGSTGFLAAAFSRVFDSPLWQSLFFLIVIAGLFVSVGLKSRIVLITSVLFLIAHLGYVTSEYFADSLGWPLSLVILGFVLIGVGYASVAINRKYLNEAA